MKKKEDELSFATTRKNVLKFKIVFVGDQYVGKTSIINRFIKNEFDESHNATIGIDFVSKNIISGDKTIRLQLWDTAGQERFRSLIPNYLRDSQVAFIVYDLTNFETFESVGKWADFIKEVRGQDVLIFAIGNKLDLAHERAVDNSIIQTKFNELGLKHFQVSAKLGQGLQNIFQCACQKLLNLPQNSKPLKVQPLAPIQQIIVENTTKTKTNPQVENKSMKLHNQPQNVRLTQKNCC